jgi:hypothetical protein
MGERLSLLDAAKSVQHSHKGQDVMHPQFGNPLFDWWAATRFLCPLCLAIMVAGGTDVALEFVHTLPFRVERDADVRWWRAAYLATLPYVVDPLDREYLRERMADALRRGKERHALVAAGGSDG